jgi:hypothetical protein
LWQSWSSCAESDAAHHACLCCAGLARPVQALWCWGCWAAACEFLCHTVVARCVCAVCAALCGALHTAAPLHLCAAATHVLRSTRG